MGLIRRAPDKFGAGNSSVIDRDDQVMLFKAQRGSPKGEASQLPTAARLCDIYSYARNTGQSLSKTLKRHYPEVLSLKEVMIPILKGYEAQRKLPLP